ncbi:MAG: hypothetical protein HUU46_22155 [Candidatus Hydrogenedentes bacterium]|nr:hypothetical protein [Candidatus Hydrogenedentota bacterium]
MNLAQRVAVVCGSALVSLTLFLPWSTHESPAHTKWAVAHAEYTSLTNEIAVLQFRKTRVSKLSNELKAGTRLADALASADSALIESIRPEDDASISTNSAPPAILPMRTAQVRKPLPKTGEITQEVVTSILGRRDEVPGDRRRGTKAESWLSSYARLLPSGLRDGVLSDFPFWDEASSVEELEAQEKGFVEFFGPLVPQEYADKRLTEIESKLSEAQVAADQLPLARSPEPAEMETSPALFWKYPAKTILWPYVGLQACGLLVLTVGASMALRRKEKA